MLTITRQRMMLANGDLLPDLLNAPDVERYRSAPYAAGMALPGCCGPVGRSATELRFFHLATVFGLIPCRLARVLRLS
jgi:hypothetical protein